jgi:hypothetical protein
MSDQEFMDVITPVILENGKTIWTKVGTAFPNTDTNKKHAMVISLTAVPLAFFTKEEIKLYVFPSKRNYNQNSNWTPKTPDKVDTHKYHDDVPF